MAACLALAIWFFFVLIFDLMLLGILVASEGKLNPDLLPWLLLLNPTDIYRLLNIVAFEGGAQLTGVLSLGSDLPWARPGYGPPLWSGLSFSWLFQPENVNRDHVLYVHDMAQTDWEHPDDTALIDARKAFFVVGSERTGAMGPTLASFAEKSDAEGVAEEHGGEVVAFADVKMEHLAARGNTL